MTEFIELNSGQGQAEHVRHSEIVRIVPRYTPLGWPIAGYMVGSILHLRNRTKVKVVEIPVLVRKKIEEAK